MAVAYGKGNLIQKDLELKSEVTSIRQQVAAPGIPLGKLDSLGRKRGSWSSTPRGLDHEVRKYLETQV